MAGFGRFKLTDALPDQPDQPHESQTGGPGQGSAPVRKGKGKGKIRQEVGSGTGKVGTAAKTPGVASSKRQRTARAPNEMKPNCGRDDLGLICWSFQEPKRHGSGPVRECGGDLRGG